jgi:hypothetical protein
MVKTHPKTFNFDGIIMTVGHCTKLIGTQEENNMIWLITFI